MSRLVVNPDAPEEWAIELQPGTISLGRSAENNFHIEHPSVSSAHCQVTVSDSGTWLKDLGSTAGTFVDGELVEETKLKTGQIIRIIFAQSWSFALRHDEPFIPNFERLVTK